MRYYLSWITIVNIRRCGIFQYCHSRMMWCFIGAVDGLKCSSNDNDDLDSLVLLAVSSFTGKIKVLENSRRTRLKPCLNQKNYKKNELWRSETTMVKLDMTNKKATVNTCYHMNSQNDCWMMQLKAIEEEHYSIGN